LINLTPKQRSALQLLMRHKFCLLYGGARSGKTFVIIYYVIARAIKYPGSLHLVCRRYSTDVRSSIWDITIPSVIRLLGLQRGEHYDSNEQMMEIQFSNGSRIICSGLDDNKRLDKILGQEFATEYINESNDVAYITFLRLRTRLSQKVEGCTNRIIVDLNPAGDGHWTYKLFFRGIEAQSLQPLEDQEKYGALQLNPKDNEANLAADFIHDMLEPLTGDQRARFLDGIYQSNNELLVFHSADANWLKPDEFQQWCLGRQSEVRIIGGLDVGYQDADATCLLAYIDGDPLTWMIYEYKAYREDLADLAKGIRKGLNWVAAELPWYPNPQMIQIYSDTNTIRYGAEGEKKKNWHELQRVYGFNTTTAFKRDKALHVELLRSEYNAGTIKVAPAGLFADETTQIVWHKNPIDGTIEHIIDDEVYHPDLMFALMYAFNFLISYGNKALMKKIQVIEDKKEPSNMAIESYEAALREQAKHAETMDKMLEVLNADEALF
jgi:Phage terminase large subunit